MVFALLVVSLVGASVPAAGLSGTALSAADLSGTSTPRSSATNTGPSWTLQSTPDPMGSVGSYLSSVSCGTSKMCMGVGTYYTTFNPPPGIQRTLAESWNGTSWAIVTTPPISGVDNALLSAVSCRKKNSCIAVGYTVTKPDNPVVRALVESWNGTLWSIVATPLPAAATSTTLADVWCASPEACVAVGSYAKAGNELPLSEAWNGSAWSILNAPNPHAENGSTFTAIDCVTASTCEVTGDYDYADVAQSLIAYSYRATTWDPQKQKNPVGEGESNSNDGLSCADANACAAVGSWTNNAPLALAELWNGVSWSRRRVPAPSGSKTDELNGVSCVSENACIAVGDWADNLQGNPNNTLSEKWNGTEWHVSKTPALPGSSSSLSDVTCLAATDCLSVGYSFDTSTGTAVTLAEQYASTTGA